MNIDQWLGKDNQLGKDIWERKYQYNNESLDEWFDRVSCGDSELRRLLVEKKFLFGGRALANIGTKNSGSYFNCYSKGYIEDDLNEILQAAKDIGITFKAQGGQGLSLSKIRPKGTVVNNRFESDGILPFMEIYNTVTSSISQGGSRKGALMISLNIKHKEVESFIKIKSELGKIEKANLSLEIDDEFMYAVQKYYKTGEVVVLKINRRYGSQEIEYEITPIEIFKLLAETSYDWAEPACLFTNRFRNYNLMEYVDSYKIETANP